MTPHKAMELALGIEGINFADERAGRLLKSLKSLGFDVTAIGNQTEWKDREPQLLGLVQDEI